MKTYSPLMLLFVAVCFPFTLPAGEPVPRWPKGYVIAEGSESPDGRYGVLIPTREEQELMADEKIVNILVNLKTHRRLCVIRGAQYWESQNHYGLTVDWAEDSRWCAVTYDGRYGFENITLVEPKGSTCTQTDLGKHIQKALDSTISQQTDADSYGSAHFRSAPGSKVLVRATSYTNPKGFEDRPTYCALFQGTFDLVTRKWTRSDARSIKNFHAMEAAYGDRLDRGITFSSDEDRLRSYDELLNDVYSAVRMVLPSERFASVKKEQIAWLKKLAGSDSAAKKCEFMAARIQELRQLLW
jgi:hypothetical protein